MPSPVRLRNLDDAQLQRLVTKITGAATPSDRTAVLNRFADQLDAEAWQERAQGLVRSQGLATDGSSAIADERARDKVQACRRAIGGPYRSVTDHILPDQR